jgi:capsular polysaccharide biosynthesis protein
MAAHQTFMAEDGAGADLDDRLEGIFDDELGQRDELITGETPKRPKSSATPAPIRNTPVCICFYGPKCGGPIVNKGFP